MRADLNTAPGKRKKRTAAIRQGILRTCAAFHDLILKDLTPQAALKTLKESAGAYPRSIIDALEAASGELFQFEPATVETDALNERMVLAADLRTIHGTLLLTRGAPITHSLLIRLKSFRERHLLPKEVQVLIPRSI